MPVGTTTHTCLEIQLHLHAMLQPKTRAAPTDPAVAIHDYLFGLSSKGFAQVCNYGIPFGTSGKGPVYAGGDVAISLSVQLDMGRQAPLRLPWQSEGEADEHCITQLQRHMCVSDTAGWQKPGCPPLGSVEMCKIEFQGLGRHGTHHHLHSLGSSCTTRNAATDQHDSRHYLKNLKQSQERTSSWHWMELISRVTSDMHRSYTNIWPYGSPLVPLNSSSCSLWNTSADGATTTSVSGSHCQSNSLQMGTWAYGPVPRKLRGLHQVSLI